MDYCSLLEHCGNCETYCEDHCEKYCQKTCEQNCQSSCQRFCEDSCERSCQSYAEKNTAPGTPASITLPSTIKSGDVINISWGAASDSNLSGYILQRSINNGSYAQIYKGSNRSYKETVQTTWDSVRYRVCGYDPYTSGSYRTSNIVKVTHNAAPVITGQDEDLGTKNSAFEKSFRVNDPDGGQSLTVRVSLNGAQLNEYINASRDFDYTVKITDEMLRGLETNKRNTITITCSDGTTTTSRNWYFIRTNQSPKITLSNGNMGLQNKEFSFTFKASDPDGDNMTGKIYIDGVQVEDLGPITEGKNNSYSIKREDFIVLKNGEHKIRIDIVDSEGSQSSSFITFNKMVTWYLYEYTEELAAKPVDVRVDMLANISAGAVKKVEVSNNVKDASPTWEVIEDGKWYKFKNGTKTATNWGLGVRVRIDRGEAKADSYIYGFNISYA